MDEQVRQSSFQVGRNEPCPCGSGKKYKKCCMPKDEEQEQLQRELHSINDVTDQYFSVKEYIEESGYPVNMFDYFLLEILNITGGVLQAFDKLSAAEIKNILSFIRKEAKEFYLACQECEHACLAAPMKTISFEPLAAHGVPVDKYPGNLQKPVSLNLFYFEFLYVISDNLAGEIRRFIPEDESGQITATVHDAFFDFVSDNCWDSCRNKCLLEHEETAYCKFCLFGGQNLPCPKKGEITYTETKVKEEDMIH